MANSFEGLVSRFAERGGWVFARYLRGRITWGELEEKLDRLGEEFERIWSGSESESSGSGD